MTFTSILAVGLGGALGALARYGLSVTIGQNGVLVANIIGCFLIGTLVSFFALKTSVHAPVSLFLTVGLLGGFTTFSAFSLETMAMIDAHRYLPAATYVLASVGGGLLAFITGRLLIRMAVL